VADWIAQRGIDVTTAVPATPAVEGLIRESQLHAADLIVMGTHGQSGLGRWIYGSVAEGVVRCAGCPVILVRPTGPLASLGPKPDRAGVLVPLDGSRFAEAALPHALELARLFRGTVTVVRAVVSPVLTARGASMYDYFAPESVEEVHLADVTEAEAYLATVADELRREGAQVRTVVGENWPVDVITREALAAGSRLVVMATHAKLGLFNWIMGRTTVEVLHRSLVPVMLVRPAGDGLAAPDAA
jgi:nucleotide-binding universal stress UspA family protein